MKRAFRYITAHFVEEVWAVERWAERQTRWDVEHLSDVTHHTCSGGCSETEDRHATELLLHDAQELVVGPEVVTPLRAAVHLIDNEARESTCFVHLLQFVHEPDTGVIGNQLSAECWERTRPRNFFTVYFWQASLVWRREAWVESWYPSSPDERVWRHLCLTMRTAVRRRWQTCAERTTDPPWATREVKRPMSHLTHITTQRGRCAPAPSEERVVRVWLMYGRLNANPLIAEQEVESKDSCRHLSAWWGWRHDVPL